MERVLLDTQIIYLAYRGELHKISRAARELMEDPDTCLLYTSDGGVAFAVVAMHERHRLPVFAEDIRVLWVVRVHVDEGQLRRVILQVQRHTEDVVATGKIDDHPEGRAHFLRGLGRTQRQVDWRTRIRLLLHVRHRLLGCGCGRRRCWRGLLS